MSQKAGNLELKPFSKRVNELRQFPIEFKVISLPNASKGGNCHWARCERLNPATKKKRKNINSRFPMGNLRVNIFPSFLSPQKCSKGPFK